MAIKHGDKIFVAIAVLICVEISTFTRMYRKAAVSPPPVNNQDSNRRTSTHPTPSSADVRSNLHNNSSWNGNSYIRFSNPDNEEAPEYSPSAASPENNFQLSSSSSLEIKPRVVFLGEGNDQDLATATSSKLPQRGRSVEALGDLDCCSKDPFEFITPEEKPFYDECTPMVDWQTRHYPTCNMLHELPLIESDDNTHTQQNITDDREAKVTLINTKGSWRSVWKVVTQLPFQNDNNNDDGPQEIVLKTLRYNREFDEESFQLQYVDSMAMERLTSSPYIANEYGFCGQSVLTEFAPKSGRDLIKNKKLKTWQRLQIAHDLAAALSDMHSIDYPRGTNATLTHNDINIANTIQGDKGRIKFNDFNIGVLMRWNKTKPCGSPVRFSAPLWRSPEEIILEDTGNTTHATTRNLNYVQPDKSDTYALGNLLFQVLTTHQPWTWLEPEGRLEVEEVIQKKLAGELPYIPSKFHSVNKTGVQAMYYSTLACYAHDPEDRPTSYQLKEALRIALDWTQQGLDKTKEEVKELFDFRQKKMTGVDIPVGRPHSRRAAATPAADTSHHIDTTAEMVIPTNSTANVAPAMQRYNMSNKTKELLQHKNKQIEDAEVAKRTSERRQVKRPKIGVHHFSPPFKRGNREMLVVDAPDNLPNSNNNGSIDESSF